MTTNGTKKSILVVDDEVSFREVLKMAIEPWGYQVYLAADGREALEYCTKRSTPMSSSPTWLCPTWTGLACSGR